MAKYDVQITEGALGDLDGILSFIADQRGEDAAQEWLDRFEQIINSLEQFPERGSLPPPLAELGIVTFRQLPMLQYRILYEVIGNQVFVVLIGHTKRDFQSLLQERLLRQ
jgi:toxin ParE1/3/4